MFYHCCVCSVYVLTYLPYDNAANDDETAVMKNISIKIV